MSSKIIHFFNIPFIFGYFNKTCILFYFHNPQQLLYTFIVDNVDNLVYN